MPTPPSDELIARYLAGELSPEISADVRASLDASPHRRGVLAGIRASIRPDAIITPPEVDASFAKWAAMAREVSPLKGKGQPRVTTPRFAYRGLRRTVMGTMIGIAGAIAMLVVRYEQKRTNVPHIYRTAAGQRASVILADGSRVILAPQTTLTTAGDLAHGDRNITLEGQAEFTVTHAGTRPFVVQAGRIVTRVLGTTFDVRHYTDDAAVWIAVTSGRVASGTDIRAPIALRAGMVARMTDSTVAVSAITGGGSLTQWADGPLRFRNVAVAEVLATLGRWYGVRFALADTTLAPLPITATLDYSNRADLITALETLLDVTATAQDTVVTLHRRHQAAQPHPRRYEQQQISSPYTTEVGR